jgi:ABC-2 type transport system permease protein
MKIVSIAGANVRRLLRDRSNIFFVFILPLGIILIIGAMFGSGFDPVMGVVAPVDAGLGQELVALLEGEESFVTRFYETEEAMLLAVERGSAQAGVVIPEEYDTTLRDGGTTELGFIARLDGSGPQLRTAVESALSQQAARVRAAGLVVDRTGQPFDGALAVVSTVDPGIADITVETRAVGDAIFPATLGQFDLGASSQLVLFMYLTGLTGSAALIQSRTYGVSTRMLSTPTSSRTIILGETLGRYGVVLVQGVYIVLVTLIVFRVNWGSPVGAVAVLLAFGAVAAGTAMLMGTLFRNDQQAGGIGVMVGLGVAALGGCMVPLEVFSPTMRTVAHFTPHAWALDAFTELVRRDATVMDILPELGALVAFAAGILAVASWRFRRVLTAP